MTPIAENRDVTVVLLVRTGSIGNIARDRSIPTSGGVPLSLGGSGVVLLRRAGAIREVYAGGIAPVALGVAVQIPAIAGIARLAGRDGDDITDRPITEDCVSDTAKVFRFALTDGYVIQHGGGEPVRLVELRQASLRGEVIVACREEVVAGLGAN